MLLSAAVQCCSRRRRCDSAPFVCFGAAHGRAPGKLPFAPADSSQTQAGWMTVVAQPVRNSAWRRDEPILLIRGRSELEFELNREYRTKYPQDSVRHVGCGVPLYHARQKSVVVRVAPSTTASRARSRSVPTTTAAGRSRSSAQIARATWVTSSRTRAFRRRPTSACVSGICLRYDPSVEQPDSVEAVPPA